MDDSADLILILWSSVAGAILGIIVILRIHRYPECRELGYNKIFCLVLDVIFEVLVVALVFWLTWVY